MAQIERNEIFDLAYRFVTETSENIFLTGKAGTGKTTFLKYLKQNASKNMVVAAPTGVAAINANGVTLHSLFQLPFHPFLPTRANKDELLAKIRYNKQRQQLLRKMELLVIDEISMVRCDVMDAIDTILRTIRRNYDTPFGGVQLLCIGDLHQLPPVAQNHEWSILQEYYTTPFFFDSLSIKEQMPLLIELNKIYRQKEDSFVRLLNKVRNNQMNADDFEDLHMRYDPLFTPMPGEKYITLTSHNKQAAEINQHKIENLITPAYTFKAVVEEDFPDHAFPADAQLVLKKEAQVMFLKNDIVAKRYFNGKIGVVKHLEKDKIIVDCDGTEIEVGKETWENTRYILNQTDGKLEQETLGTFTQYPLRLAWAITIHKSQGLTFEKVMIDAGASFSSGQVYVALSRCTSLQGIVLLSKLSSATLFSNDHVIKGQQFLTHKGSLAERFTGARQVFTQQLISQIFSFNDVEIATNLLLHHITQQQGKLNAESLPWIENIKQHFSADKLVGLKFIDVVTGILKDEPVIENNAAAQKRISDAANHFEPKFMAYQQSLQNHPLITEHKETAGIINEQLQQLAQAVNSLMFYLQYCKQPFSVTTFLQHKLKYVLAKTNLSCYASGKKEVITDVANTELYNTLKRWRDMMVEQENVAIYMVANQATLKEIAAYLPLTKKDLLHISGFGKAKADKYGDDVIEAVVEYCTRNDIKTNMAALPSKASKEKALREKNAVTKTDTKTISFNLYKEGKNIAAIAAERNLTVGSIESHLIPFIVDDEIDINDLVSAKKQQLILDAVAIHGAISHKTLIDNLPADFTYGEIKMVLAAQKSKTDVMKLTPEQQAIINTIGDIKINAVAGSGKTTTIIEYAKTRPATAKILYLAFNKSVKLEALKKFAQKGLHNVTVETAHSLAYKKIVPRYQYKVRPQGYKTHELAALLGLQGNGEKHHEYVIANHINKFIALFCNSDKLKVQDVNYLETISDAKAKTFVKTFYHFIETQTRNLLAKMDKGEIDITHDFYLKKFQLQNPVLPFDYILFDEGQDASPAMLDIFLKQPATKVIVGDTHQQIYNWRYAVNSLEKTGLASFNLSNSFRFSANIAALAANVLFWKNEIAETQPVAIKGLGNSQETKTKAVIGRTNLGLLLKAIDYVTEKKNIQQIYFEGNINSYTYADEGASLYDVLNLYNNKHGLIKDVLIKSMGSVKDLEEYIEKTEDAQLSMMLEIVKKYGNDIYDIIKKIKEKHVANDDKEKAEIVFSTVHRCKGMEYDAVHLVNDFITQSKVAQLANDFENDEKKMSKLNEEINLLYVAVTRTKNILHIPEELLPTDFPKLAQINIIKKEEPKEVKPVVTDGFMPNSEYSKYTSTKEKIFSVELVRTKYSEAYKPWTPELDVKLTQMFNNNKSDSEMIKHFGRNAGAIRARLKKLGLK